MKRLVTIFLLLLPGLASAAEPTVRDVTVRGLQIGVTTTLTITGDDFGAAPKLLLPFPATQTLLPESTDKTATFTVAVPEAVTPGWHQMRLTTANGASLPVIIGVDRLPQVGFGPTVERLPAAVHGSVSGSTTVETKFEGKAKQKVTIEIEAQRQGSKLRPIIHLVGPKRKQVAWCWGTPALGGDSRLETILPADGTYTIAIHDSEYAGAAPGHFRMKIGDFAAVDRVFPPVIGAAAKTVELLGPSGAKTVAVPTNRDADFARLDWPASEMWTGPRPFVPVSTRPEFLEAIPSTGKPQELSAGPLGVSGKLATANEEDLYRIPTTPGTKLKFDLSAERLGSPLDVSLVLRNDAGIEIARADDGTGSLDPTLEFTVPEKMASVVVAVVDAQGRGGPRGIYRLTVDPVKAEPTPNVVFSISSGRISVPAGGIAVVPVVAQRTNFTGPIRLSATGLPKGVTLANATIPEGADGTLAVLKSDGTPGEATVTAWSGTAAIGERAVAVRDNPLAKIQPWLAREIAVAVIPTVPAIAIDWRDLPVTTALVPTRKLVLPIKVTRPDPTTLVRLTLLTDQAVPFVNNAPDAAKAIRAEKPVEVAAKVADSELSVLVPPDLPASGYDIAIQAEVLSADRKTVLAIVFTPIRRIPVAMPLALKLPAAVEAKLDPKLGYVAEIGGTLERFAGITGEVTLTVTGLPTGARLEPATAKVAASAVAAKLIFPAATAPGKLAGIRWTATVSPDPAQPALLVKSREVEVTVTIPAK